MGEIADMILDGILDEQTGEYIGGAVGYPRTKQSGFYNSMKKRKPIKGKPIKGKPIEGKSLGGLHLVGKNVTVEEYGKCIITDYIGKRGRKRYVVIDEKGKEHKVIFSKLKFKKT